MNEEKKTFEMPVLLTFEIPKIDGLNVSLMSFEDLTPWG